MPKMHELLAVESKLKGQAQKNRLELQSTLEKKRHHFSEKIITLKSSVEGVPDEQRERSDIQTTVGKEVAWLSGFFVKAIDAAYAIDLGNTTAKADIVLEDGTTTLAKDVPATALLQLEKRAAEVLEFIHTIPTLDPTKGFTPDKSREKGIYVAREVTKPSTKKEQKVLVKYPATEKHPAQTEMIVEDVRVGTIHEQEWSSLITPATKAELLDRGEQVARAIARARSRANETEIDVKTNKIGKSLLDHIFQPLTT